VVIPTAVLWIAVRPLSEATATTTVDSAEQIYGAMEMGDLDALRAVMSEELVLEEPEGVPIGGIYHGLEAVIGDLFPAVAERYPDASITIDRYVADGDAVVALGTMRATAAETGSPFESSFAHVFDFEDGLVVRWASLFDTALFNAALDD
jgi:ketosteroid isomerase-like protein